MVALEMFFALLQYDFELNSRKAMWNPHHCMCLLLTRQNSLTYKWKWKAKSLCTHDCQCLSSYGRIVSFGYIKLSTRERYWEVEDCFSRLGKHFPSLRANVLVWTWNYLSHLGHQRIGALMKHSFRTQEACWTSKPNSSRSAEEAENWIGWRLIGETQID